MCWVMPPCSPPTTLVLRIVSSSVVLPWSTWPMTVTTGGRGRSDASSSSYSGTGAWPAAVAPRRQSSRVGLELLCDEIERLWRYRKGGGNHLAHLEQRLDHIARLDPDPLGEQGGRHLGWHLDGTGLHFGGVSSSGTAAGGALPALPLRLDRGLRLFDRGAVSSSRAKRTRSAASSSRLDEAVFSSSPRA